jgi:DNA polymerase-3 subunit delta'
MQFKDIVGQEEIKQRLIKSVQTGRISHTQLFLGPEGCGTLALAVAYTQFINCLQPTETDSCGQCVSCIKIQKLIHPDIHFTFPTITNTEKKKLSNEFIEEWRSTFTQNPYISELQWLLQLDEEGKKQGNITAEECRDIIRKLSLKSYEAKFKTVIIWLPEYLRLEGNILLKLLEEPPEKTLIILVAQDADKVIATILSRAQTLKIPRLKDEEIAEVLIRQAGVDAAEAETIARVSEGNLALANSLAGAGRSDYHDLFVEWMRACYGRKVDAMNLAIEKIIGTGREFIKSFTGYSLHMLRAVFLYQNADHQLIKLSEQERQFIVKFSIAFNNDNIEHITKALNQSTFHLERNADLRITFLNLSLYIAQRMIKPKQA